MRPALSRGRLSSLHLDEASSLAGPAQLTASGTRPALSQGRLSSLHLDEASSLAGLAQLTASGTRPALSRGRLSSLHLDEASPLVGPAQLTASGTRPALSWGQLSPLWEGQTRTWPLRAPLSVLQQPKLSPDVANVLGVGGSVGVVMTGGKPWSQAKKQNNQKQSYVEPNKK